MADMTALDDILNGDDATATPVQNNFQTIEAYINGTDLVRTDGTEVMAADLDLNGNKVVNLANGTADDDAMAYGQRSRLAYHGTLAQVFTNPESGTSITVDTEVYDIGTVGSVGSGTLTIPTTGLYLLQTEAYLSAASTSVSITVAWDSVNIGLTAVTSTSVVHDTNIRYCTAADTLVFTGSCSSGSSATLNLDIKLYRLA